MKHEKRVVGGAASAVGTMGAVFASGLVVMAHAGPVGETKEDEHGHRAVAWVMGDGQAEPGGAGGRSELWQTLGPFGGDVMDVAVSPTSPDVVLAGIAPSGSTGGTLYRSTDGGETWSEVSALSGTSVYEISFTDTGRVYIGTFDAVWRSDDDGASWTQQLFGFGANDQTFAVTVDPSDPDVVWAGVAEALGNQTVNVVRSTDGGQSWQNVTPPLGTPMNGRSIAIDPLNTENVAVAFSGAFGGGAVWVSTNGGQSWTDRSAGLPGNPMNAAEWVDGRLVVAGGMAFGSQFVGVYASDNMGATWQELSDGSWPSLVVRDIAVDPNDGEVLLVTTIQGVNRTEDGGATWSFGIGGTASASMQSVRFAPGDSDRLVFGADSIGVLRSGDAGETITPSSEGIGALDVYSVAANPNDPNDMALAFQGQNNGGVYSTTDGGETWTLEDVPGTRYNTVRYSPEGLLHAISDGPTTIADEALYRREADGDWMYLGPNQGPAFEARLFALRFSQNNPDLILMGGRDFGSAFGHDATIWLSQDRGQNWDKVYESFVNFEAVRSIEIVEDGQDQTVVAAYEATGSPQEGGVLRSTDGGENWSASSSGLPAGVQGMSLSAMPDDIETFYLADRHAGGGLWISDDAGQSWASSGFSLPLRDVVADPNDAEVVYGLRTTADRVFRSEDRGVTFEAFNDGLSGAGVSRAFGYAGGSSPRLLLATGTGVWATDAVSGECIADWNGDGEVDVNDFFAYLSDFEDGDPRADLNNDGEIDINDFFIFLQEFEEGC